MGKIAFVFAGQGAQHPGMGQELAEISPAAAEVFQKLDALRPGTSAAVLFRHGRRTEGDEKHPALHVRRGAGRRRCADGGGDQGR